MKKFKYGIFSDIHSNLEALHAILMDMHEQGVTHPICLGDIVGYNASPRECLQVVRQMGCPAIQGNHDEIVGKKAGGENFNALAGEGIAHSRKSLDDDDKKFLLDLPMVLKIKEATFVHASLDDPEHWNYVNSDLEAESSFTYQQSPLCFIGHTHVPRIYAKNWEVREIPVTSILHIDKNTRYLINVGSVGQPRDRDWRASYAIYQPDKALVEFRRVEYDLKKCQERIIKRGLPDPLATRLAIGA